MTKVKNHRLPASPGHLAATKWRTMISIKALTHWFFSNVPKAIAEILFLLFAIARERIKGTSLTGRFCGMRRVIAA